MNSNYFCSYVKLNKTLYFYKNSNSKQTNPLKRLILNVWMAVNSTQVPSNMKPYDPTRKSVHISYIPSKFWHTVFVLTSTQLLHYFTSVHTSIDVIYPVGH